MTIGYTVDSVFLSRDAIFEFPNFIPSYHKLQLHFEELSYLTLARKLEYRNFKGRQIAYERATEFVITDSYEVQRFVGDPQNCTKFIAEYKDLLFSCLD